MKRRKFFETRKEALAEVKRREAAGDGKLSVFDLKRLHPGRKKQRFLVGDHFDWLAV